MIPQANALQRFIAPISLILFALSTCAQAQEKQACDIGQARKDMNVIMERDYHERLVLAASWKDAEAQKGAKLTMAEGKPFIEKLQQADKLNQDTLDRIVDACGWPTRSGLGAEAVRIAGRIMIHAPSGYTRKHFDQMWASYKAGETSALRMATVIDDGLIDQGKPQRYGTRGRGPTADAAPDSIEDPEHLAERRTAFGIALVHSFADDD